jgi:hypothetical protein
MRALKVGAEILVIWAILVTVLAFDWGIQHVATFLSF